MTWLLLRGPIRTGTASFGFSELFDRAFPGKALFNKKTGQREWMLDAATRVVSAPTQVEPHGARCG